MNTNFIILHIHLFALVSCFELNLTFEPWQFVAKKLDKRLMDLGGTAILERGLGDDQHPSGYDYVLCYLL
jgi:hypothetical protein